jgi:hypothetical protein
LTGPLPYNIQSSGQFIEIDIGNNYHDRCLIVIITIFIIANNKIYGGIEQLVTGSNMTSISLQVNRLSGKIIINIITVLVFI